MRAVAFQEPPYTNSLELYAELKKVTPEPYQGALTDLFEQITLYENRAVKATYRREQSDWTIVVPKVPARAGIDPFDKLIDRKTDDNTVKVEKL